MDEIDYKLRSQNPTLISHVISKLIETIKKKNEIEEKDIFKISEYKILSSKCSSDDSIVCASACQALIVLAEIKLLDAKTALATLMGHLSSSKNYEVITVAVSQLLILNWEASDKHDDICQYTLQMPNQHPFITIMNQEKLSWRSVLNQMKIIMHAHDKRIIKLLRPVFLYILCNPSTDLCESSEREAWQLIIKSNNTSDLQIEILLWFCNNQEHSSIHTNCRILELAEISLLKKNKEYCTSLIPLITSLTIHLLGYGYEPVQNFCIILDLIEQCDYYIGNITIALMTEIILICPAPYLFHALQICKIIMEKMRCDIVFLNALVASLLKWLAYPSLLCSNALILAKELIAKIASYKKTDHDDGIISNKLFFIFSHNNNYIQFYTELMYNLYILEDNILLWLENLSFAPIDLRYMCKLILCGIFLHSEEPLVIQKTCYILMQIAREINTFASHMLSLILYKLTKTCDSSTLKYLLLAVPEFAGSKENLPIIVHTLDTLLNSDKPLKYFAIQLYMKALERESRCYRFMSAALMNIIENDCSWHSNVTCARAIKHICERWPEHGEELVPLLSQILNKCVDLNGGAASALALNGISALCKAAIIGICSTWQVLAPKMRKERRTVVLESLCEFMADMPSYPFPTSEDYDRLTTDIITHLWSYVSSEDVKIIEAAFKGLRSYHLEQIPLSALPLEFRSDLILPNVSSKNPSYELEKSEQTMSYIPGTCWIQMLKKVNKLALPMAGNLLIFYIEDEINSFRSRIYSWPQGEPANFKYLPEKSVIRAVGEHLRRTDKSDLNNQRVIVECLRIFAHKYKRLLPNIKWDFLKETLHISEEAKEYGLSIASRHCYISLSAKLLTESYLAMYKSESDAGQLLLNEKHIVLYSNLDKLCQAIQPNDLKKFLETSLDYVIDKMLLNDDKSINLFNRIMSSYANALRSDEIHLGNRTLLSTMLLEKCLNQIDLTSGYVDEYFTAVMELSATDVERMTSPNIWWEVTSKKLKNVIVIRTELAFRKFTDTPLKWMNEPIDIAISNPGMQEYLLECIQKVQRELRFEQSCMDWILDFMTRIDTLMTESAQEKDIIFYCDILFISIICLSGMDCLLPRKTLLITSQDIKIRLFPQAILGLANRQTWKSTIRQVTKWLNHMRKSSIPDVYKLAFQSSLILLRHDEDYNSQWISYLSVETAMYT